MDSYEYCELTFRWGNHIRFALEGESVIADDEEEAKELMSDHLRASSEAVVAARQSAANDARVEYEQATTEWRRRHDELVASSSIETVETEVRKATRRRAAETSKKDIVAMADGARTETTAGQGAQALEQLIARQIGKEPSTPDDQSIPSLSEAAESLWSSVTQEEVSGWSSSMEPPDVALAVGLHEGPLQSAALRELNRLGGAGWRLVDKSEDRTIGRGQNANGTVAVGVRYTLMRAVT